MTVRYSCPICEATMKAYHYPVIADDMIEIEGGRYFNRDAPFGSEERFTDIPDKLVCSTGHRMTQLEYNMFYEEMRRHGRVI